MQAGLEQVETNANFADSVSNETSVGSKALAIDNHKFNFWEKNTCQRGYSNL